MTRWRILLVLAVLGAILAAVGGCGLLGGGQPAAQPPAQTVTQAPMQTSVKMEWLGHSHFRFTSVDGKVILTNPFVNNPDSPVKVSDMTKVNAILVPNGHGDELGQTIEIAQATGARVIVPFELGSWLIEQGVPQPQVTRSNPGGRAQVDGVTIRVLSGVHGSGLPRPTAQNPYGGPTASFMITFEDGWTVYFGGSSAATSDMALWARLYKPHAAIIVMSGGTEPLDFATSVQLLKTDNPNLTMVLPHHHRATQPQGATNIEEVQAAMDSLGLGLRVTAPVVGQPVRQ